MVNNVILPVSLPEIYAPREDLMRRFDYAAEKQAVCLQAASGYGKSVSTLLWLKKTGRRSAWLCFDEYDNTPALFYIKFCRALLSVLPPQDDSLTALFNSPVFRDSPVDFTIEILTRAEYGSDKAVLVLDDFHAISSNSVLKALPYALKRLPVHISVFLLSKAPLSDVFKGLIDAGQIPIFKAQDLSFTAAEIQKHFANYGHSTTRREAEAIRVFSGGWIILLNMMLRSGNLNIGADKTKLTFKEFFENNIWNALDEQRRDFLLKTAVPDSFSLELCKELTGDFDCEDTLDMLIRRNANISYSNGDYRYHQMFLEFLREKINESDIDLPSVHRRIAEYYMSKNDILQARRFAIKSGDMPAMTKAVGMINRSKDINLDEYVELASILDMEQLPDALCDSMPFLYLQKAFVSFLVGKRRDFECYMDRIYRLLPVIAENFPQFLETNVVNSILDYRYSFSEYAERVRGMPAISHRHDIDQVSSIAINMPFLHRSSRDCCELTDDAVREAAISAVFKDLLKYDCDNLFSGIRAGLYIEQNKLVDARDLLIRAEGSLNDKVSIDIGWAIHIMLAETALLAGDRESHGHYCSLAKEYYESRSAYQYSKNHTAYETRAKLWDGDQGAAREWLDQYFVSDSEYGVFYKIYQNFTTIRAHIVLRNSKAALSALNAVRELGKDFDRILDVAEADILASIVEWFSGKKNDAQDRLRKALAGLRPYGFIRIAANEGRAVMPILAAVIRKMDREAEKDEILYRFVKEVQIAAYEHSKRFNGLACGYRAKPAKLSPKQTLVLDLLSKGYKNAEIIKITGYSINTIRSYTRIIYQKLEVTNVMDAILKAKELGILSG